MRKSFVLSALVMSSLLLGCPKKDSEEEETLTSSEALQAVEESQSAAQAESLTADAIEISTNFTIGGAVQQAAQELRSFIQSQLPCAEITLQDATLTVEYGAKAGLQCTYHGHTFSGTSQVKVSKNEEGSVIVEHTWTKLSNGVVQVTGDATVTWSRVEQTRHVVHHLTWTRIRDGESWNGEGDRTQRPLPDGILVGFQVDGSRAWTGRRGRFDLTIEGVQMRWVDPVPQAGSYQLVTPNDKMLRMSFQRVDADTIQVTVSNGRRSFSFNVNSVGISQKGA